MKTLKVKLTFAEPLLGTWPANQNVAREYIASKSPDAATIEDEVAALGAAAAADKAMTVFPRNDAGAPILYDYQVKGFFKDSCGMLGRIGGKDEKGKKKAVNESGKLTAYRTDPYTFGPVQGPMKAYQDKMQALMETMTDLAEKYLPETGKGVLAIDGEEVARIITPHVNDNLGQLAVLSGRGN